MTLGHRLKTSSVATTRPTVIVIEGLGNLFSAHWDNSVMYLIFGHNITSLGIIDETLVVGVLQAAF